MLAFVAIFTIFLGVLSLWILKRIKHFRLRDELGLRGPPVSYLHGNLGDILAYVKKNGVSRSPWFRIEMAKKYGETMGMYFGTLFEISSTNLDFAREVMITQFHNFTDREAPTIHNAYPMENGLLQITGKTNKGFGWKDVRSIVSPVFTSGKMKKMHQTILERVDAFVDELDRKTRNGKTHMDIYDEWQALTLDTIARVAFGVNCNSIQDRNDVFYTNCQAFFQLLGLDKSWITVPLSFMFPAIGPYLRPLSDLAQVERPLVQKLKEAIAKRKKMIGTAEAEERPDLIQLLLEQDLERQNTENKPPLGDDVVLSNCHSFLLAGYETTSTALAYCTWLLAKHGDVQERLYDEIIETFSNDQPIDYEKAMKSEYLDCVYRETLRLYPPVVHFTARQCVNDTIVTGIRIPKGAYVSVPVQCVHWKEEYWPNAMQFDPDRFFSPEAKKSLAWMPFGVGPRHCVGIRFAEMEFKTAIIAAVRRFRFSIDEKEKGDLPIRINAVLMRPTDGVKLFVEKRQ
ncbi:unnamed protein product, partial [Mesorhabditis belari]|uniref:Cytochrome P450 n=1 Tax=Mesorhabditis belari TaxID=2138241 RepID=A0AAF3F1G8_9BILA